MLFNSIDFAIFLPVVFIFYWFVFNKNLLLQNLFIVASSYFFYGWWDWKSLLLMAFTSFCSWFSGYLILKIRQKQLSSKKIETYTRQITAVNIIINLCILGIFKYYNFFVEAFSDSFRLFGKELNTQTLQLILPVGISFYTFHALSYTIDIYRKDSEPTKNIVAFFAFVSFFPQLVAGPIERASTLLPQFYHKKTFNYHYAADGMRQILWGLFKKIVIADNCAVFANQIFNNSQELSGSTLVLGALFFTFQIYGDFSGYSDIAIGTGRLFGINIRRNFAFPYFSRDVAEFWRRWHISLSSWFKDYLYIPLGGSRGGNLIRIRNTFIIFLVSGFWHGANWTFIVWGGLHALFILPSIVLKTNRQNLEIVAKGKYLPTLKEFSQLIFTFLLIVFSWIFFRADNISHATQYISEIFSGSIFTIPRFIEMKKSLVICLLIIVFMFIEWMGREEEYAIAKLGLQSKPFYRYLFYNIIIVSLFWFGGNEQQFIYFQF